MPHAREKALAQGAGDCSKRQLGHTILVAAYHMLKDEEDYRDLGSAYFDRRRRDRTTKHLVSRLEGLGYEVKLEPKQAA